MRQFYGLSFILLLVKVHAFVQPFFSVGFSRSSRFAPAGYEYLSAGGAGAQPHGQTAVFQVASRAYVKPDELVLEDFTQIVDAVRVYQSLYGDCSIEKKFEVPAQEPWPSASQGLRLGRRLEQLQISREFEEEHADKMAELTKAGWDPRKETLVDDWTTIAAAIRVYGQQQGDLRIPSKFVVPEDDCWPRLARGLKLGVRVAAIRSAGRYIKDHPERKAELDEIGFEWHHKDNSRWLQTSEGRFEQVLDALRQYKQIVSDELTIPVSYVVPDEGPWTESARGLKLGNFVQQIRADQKLIKGDPARRKALTEIGFLWEDSSRTVNSSRRFELIFQAMVVFKKLKGDLFVPQSFVVPEEEPWPEETWGIKLGSRASAIRSHSTFVSTSPQRRAMLDSIGFSWELPSEIRRRNKQEAEAEAAAEDSLTPGPKSTSYKLDAMGEVEEDLPQEEPEMDAEAAAMQALVSADLAGASATAKRIRKVATPIGRIAGGSRSLLPFDLTLIFEPVAYREIAAAAIHEHMMAREYSSDPQVRQFSHFEGHLTPQGFNDVTTRAISPEDQRAMKKISYRILEFGKFNWDQVLTALGTYKAAFGDVDVPLDFVVDETVLEDLGFEERFEHMRLGEAVAGIRCGDIDGLEDSPRRKALDALGFDWGDKTTYQRFRFVPMLLGLKLYKHLYGFPMPQTDFVVPDEPQWPFWMANMPLGEWSAVARIQQQMVQEHYSHRYDMLNAMEFLWWIPPGASVPSKFYRPVK
mmetsp:Transcript_23997/g.53326  ORF Transcript_23997/g.53326 Transcript_23997/m.53326 type:complete len:752 (-) Transcript_23997:207-2462(-)